MGENFGIGSTFIPLPPILSLAPPKYNTQMHTQRENREICACSTNSRKYILSFECSNLRNSHINVYNRYATYLKNKPPYAEHVPKPESLMAMFLAIWCKVRLGCV